MAQCKAQCGLRALDGHCNCVDVISKAVSNCAIFPTQTLHTGVKAGLRAFGGDRVVGHGVALARRPCLMNDMDQ